MKRQMTNASAGDHAYGNTSGRENPIPRIHRMQEDFVEAEICNEREAIVRGDGDAVGMGPFLPHWIYARTEVLHYSGRLPEASIRHDR